MLIKTLKGELNMPSIGLVVWEPNDFNVVGFLGEMLNSEDPRTAKEQFDGAYGWSPFNGFTYNPKDHGLSYPGDPTFYPVATAKLREEMIYLYPSAWVCIVQPDGSYEIARMD